MKPRNCVIYCRVSTDEQAMYGSSLDAQERACRAFASSAGYDVLRVFVERGESAKTQNRPELKNLIKYCLLNSEEVSAVVVWKTDRLTRKLEDLLDLTQNFKRQNIDILTTTEKNGSDPESMLMRNINGVFAQYENDKNSERTRAGMREALRQGRWLWPTFGYSFVMESDGKRVVHPNEKAPIVKKAFDLAVKGIYTQAEILQIIRRDGYCMLKGHLSNILANPVYAGLIPDKYGINNGQFIQGRHEPIITQEQYFKVQDILHGRRPTMVPKRRNHPLFPLRRFVICQDCGRFMTSSIANGKKIKVPYYHCSRKGEQRVQKKVLERYYEEYLASIKPAPEILKVFEAMVSDIYQDKTADRKMMYHKAQTELDALRVRKSKVIGLIADQLISDEDGREELAKINEDIQERERLLNNTGEFEDLKSCWSFAKYFILNACELWRKGDLALKQKIQGLITPSGFTFDGRLIKPLKNPYFISIFAQKQGSCINWGG